MRTRGAPGPIGTPLRGYHYPSVYSFLALYSVAQECMGGKDVFYDKLSDSCGLGKI